MRRRLSRRPVLAAAVGAVVALAGCSHPSGHGTGTTVTTAPGTRTPGGSLSKLRGSLPAGFGAPGRAAAAGTIADLPVAPAAGFQPSSVHLAPFPGKAQLRPILAAVVNLPVPLTVRPLFASAATLQPGADVTIAAAHLGLGAPHPVLFVLDGPGYRGEHLVQSARGVAAGIVRLPAVMAPGTWCVVVEDQSGVEAAAGGGLSGTALVDLAVFTVR